MGEASWTDRIKEHSIIKIYFKDTYFESVDWIWLSENSDRWQSVVDRGRKDRVLKRGKEFLEKIIVDKLDVHWFVHRNIYLIERINNMQPCSKIYYSNAS